MINQINQPNGFFTDEELKDKEEDLLRLIKNTIIEFRKATIRERSNQFYHRKNIRDRIHFHQFAITICSDGPSGTVTIFGRRQVTHCTPRTLKLSFLLTDELYIKSESYTKYPIERGTFLKDIIYRMNIQTKEDYDLLVKSFENLLISYV